jgi:hypothetical protein
MPYREVTRARKAASKFAAHARRHAQRVAESATELFGGAPDGQEYLDLHQFQIRVGDRLDQMYERLLDDDDEHAGELQRDRELRRQRDRHLVELRELLLQLKKILDGYSGPGTAQKVFKEDPRVPMDAAATHQLTRRVHRTLLDPEFHLQGTQDGVAVNIRVLAQSLEEPMNGLGETLVALDSSESETKHTQSEKDARLAETREYNGLVARFFEALYALAGHRRLASRLRNSSHLRPGAEPPPNAEPEPGSEPDEGAPALDAVAPASTMAPAFAAALDAVALDAVAPASAPAGPAAEPAADTPDQESNR